MPSPYWNQQLSGFDQAAGNIGTALMRRPLLQRQADEQLGRTMVMKSEYDLNSARAGELLQKGKLVETLQRVAPQAQAAMLKQNFDDPAVQEFVGATAALTGQNKQDVWKAAKQGMGTMLALQGNTPMAAAVEDPVSVQNAQVAADERAKRPVVAGSGATVFGPDGKPLAEAAYTLNPGQDRFAPVDKSQMATNAAPAEPTASGQPMQPKSSEVQGVLARTIADIIKKAKFDGTDARETIAKINAATARIGALDSSGTASAQATPPAENPAPDASANEVQRRTKDGRIAIFDGNTKQFLRYAQ